MMDYPLLSLPDPAPAYLPQLEPLHTEHHNAPAQQLYGPYGIDQTLQTQLPDGQFATTQNPALQQFSLPTLHHSYTQHDADFASDSQPASAAPMGPPDRPRKRKAPTLRADNWEPYKKRILDLHITQNLPLPKVRQMIEEEYGFKAEYVACVRAR